MALIQLTLNSTDTGADPYWVRYWNKNLFETGIFFFGVLELPLNRRRLISWTWKSLAILELRRKYLPTLRAFFFSKLKIAKRCQTWNQILFIGKRYYKKNICKLSNSSTLKPKQKFTQKKWSITIKRTTIKFIIALTTKSIGFIILYTLH